MARETNPNPITLIVFCTIALPPCDALGCGIDMKYGLRDYRAVCVKYGSHLKRYGVWLGGIGMAAVHMMRLRLTGAHKKGHVRLGTRP
jgi:hypothetical protein